jgi:hypothetical protein
VCGEYEVSFIEFIEKHFKKQDLVLVLPRFGGRFSIKPRQHLSV